MDAENDLGCWAVYNFMVRLSLWVHVTAAFMSLMLAVLSSTLFFMSSMLAVLCRNLNIREKYLTG